MPTSNWPIGLSPNRIPGYIDMRPGFLVYQNDDGNWRHWIYPSGGHPFKNGSVKKPLESLQDVIQRLHIRQKFYLDHKEELPSWSQNSS